MKIIFFKLLIKLKLDKYINIFFKKNINNTLFTIPIIYQIGFEHNIISETWMIDILQKINNLKQGVFFDVGVNTGQTLIKLKSVNPTIEYIGFEPNPKCVFYVDELIKANQFSNCSLIPVALMQQNELLKLHFYSETATDAAASLIQKF